jgi:peptide deformylase
VAIRDIVITGDPVLHSTAQPVAQITQYVKDLVADMFETMDKAPGVGLAAPQIGIPLRIFVFDWEDETGSYRDVAINPILELSGYPQDEADPDSDSEGCLSIPAERFPLKRSATATLTATNLEGVQYVIAAQGWLARIFQHEFDHLNGVLYVDRLDAINAKLAKKAIKQAGWGQKGLSWSPGEDYLEP